MKVQNFSRCFLSIFRSFNKPEAVSEWFNKNHTTMAFLSIFLAASTQRPTSEPVPILGECRWMRTVHWITLKLSAQVENFEHQRAVKKWLNLDVVYILSTYSHDANQLQNQLWFGAFDHLICASIPTVRWLLQVCLQSLVALWANKVCHSALSS